MMPAPQGVGVPLRCLGPAREMGRGVQGGVESMHGTQRDIDAARLAAQSLLGRDPCLSPRSVVPTSQF
jgi:hypothetical protein